MRLAIIGATGRTGRALVEQALARGHAVRALVRSRDDGATLPGEAEIATADILKDDLGPAFTGCDAVLSAIGLPISPQTLLSPPPLFTEGTRAILSGMRAAGTTRLVVISAAFVAGRDRGPVPFRLASLGLDRIFTQMGEMEQILRLTGDVDWTAVRPGWLLDRPFTGEYTVTADQLAPGLVRTRCADLAHFMLDCAETPAWVRRTPAIARPEPRTLAGD